jgi:hypothetical protein
VRTHPSDYTLLCPFWRYGLCLGDSCGCLWSPIVLCRTLGISQPCSGELKMCNQRPRVCG